MDLLEELFIYLKILEYDCMSFGDFNNDTLTDDQKNYFKRKIENIQCVERIPY